ncbi:MAG: dTDP-glucose 4,6-dehydratase [Clostridiaceae bacterium]
MIYFVTGGAGFIGSNFLNTFVPEYPEDVFVNIDSLTYAGNVENLKAIEHCSNYHFENIDITDFELLEKTFKKYQPDFIIHFAAESHVDRSITEPGRFIKTNIIGTFNLLELARIYWKNRKNVLFHHVSTDEVYGSLGKEDFFTETTAYSPNSPYSASKAGSDHLVRAYYHTFGLPVTVTNCSNNYGPFQHQEKLIPLIIHNILNDKPIPIYGDGLNVRDWLYVIDHCKAIWTVIHNGRRGLTYNVGGNNELTNIEVVYTLCDIISESTGKSKEVCRNLIKFVKDRPGHDLRYAIDATKISVELGWKPSELFDTGIRKTVNWYIENQDWVKSTPSSVESF